MAVDQDDIRADVLTLLQNFRGVEPMKELFWSHLNYERVNKPTTRRGWPGSAAEVLADDPTLLAASGQGGDFRVLYSRLAKDRLSLADERIVTSRLLKDHPYGLFIFSDRTQTNWHFLNVKMAEEEEKRKLFRRVTVGPNEKMRTACQVISQLDLASVSPNLLGLSPLVIQERHDQAFDVEPVTEAFFRQYHATFTHVEDLIRGIRDKDRKRLYTQRLFNRLMFIAFIQKKGWLQFGGKTNQDYLSALWADYKKNGNKDMGFYHERLYNLFFHGLGAQVDYNLMKINRGGVLKEVIGTVPYLNGGLFEEDEDDKDGSIKVPDEAIRFILQGLFDHFNFTVTEATPLDIEVAVDPEMLGKVFEELVTGRHETGSYYTLKPIVSFMCREALKGYLGSSLAREDPAAMERFVDEHEPVGLKDAEAVLEALRRVRVCDPACGSGAYLLGMLHELMDLRTCLFSARNLDPISAYDRKLEIIQRNVYGVDADPFAVNIARLRLWLSLAVEFEGGDPPPLPNLKFEIEEGDSLAAPIPDAVQAFMWADEIRRYSRSKADYMKAHGERKRRLEGEVLDLRKSIASWTNSKIHDDSVFDWAVEFAEVFAEGGFDIVLANPPYVRHELITEQKPSLQKIFPEVYHGLADLFVYFYARAINLLRSDGMLCYISSDKWLRSGYGSPLRGHINKTLTLVTLTDFGDLPVFKTATTYVMILVAKKAITQAQTVLYTKVETLDPPYPDIRLLIQQSAEALPSNSFVGEKWSLEYSQISEIDKSAFISLSDLAGDKMFYGIKTGLNKAFVIDDSIRRDLIRADGKSREVIMPFATGKEIRKWRLGKPSTWLLYMPWDIDIRRYPAVHEHLSQWKSELARRPEVRDKKYNWWCLARYNPASYGLMKTPKIVYQVFQVKPCFSLDTTGAAVNNATYIIACDDLFLLGVLNSEAFWKEISRVCSPIQNGYQLMKDYLVKAFVPIPSKDERCTVEAYVKEIVDSGDDEAVDTEARLNDFITSLYSRKAKAGVK